MTINFHLNHRPNINGEEDIIILLTHNGQRKKTTIGHKVMSKNWDKENQRVKRNVINCSNLTALEINNQISKIDIFLTDVVLKNPNLTAEEVLILYKREFNKKKQKLATETKNASKRIINNNLKPNNYIIPETIDTSTGIIKTENGKKAYEYIDEFVREMSKLNEWKDSTVKKFLSLKNDLKEFNPKLTFDDFTEDSLNKFLRFMQTKRQLRNSSAEKKLSFLRWYFRWASKKGYNKRNSFNEFRPKLKKAKKSIVFLDWNELMQVYHFEPPEEKQYLTRVRDVFCFSCFTGLRYSDVWNLKRHNIAEDEINIISIKDYDNLKIELNDYSKAILKKYEDQIFPNNAALPVISNQKMNDYLKELCQLAGIDAIVTQSYYKDAERIDEVNKKYEVISTHCGRRTFISNALMLGVPVNIVMKWTGHSNYKAMEPYIAIADSEKKKAMNVFNKKI